MPSFLPSGLLDKILSGDLFNFNESQVREFFKNLGLDLIEKSPFVSISYIIGYLSLTDGSEVVFRFYHVSKQLQVTLRNKPKGLKDNWLIALQPDGRIMACYEGAYDEIVYDLVLFLRGNLDVFDIDINRFERPYVETIKTRFPSNYLGGGLIVIENFQDGCFHSRAKAEAFLNDPTRSKLRFLFA